MESSNTKIWQSMQTRVENIQRRKALIPVIKQLKKESLILHMQLHKMEEKALDNLYAGKKLELEQKTDKLNVRRTAYLELADKELSILKTNLQVIKQQRYDPAVYALDLEEHQDSLEKAITLLTEERDEVRCDTAKTAMARSHVKTTPLDSNSGL